MSTPKVPKAAKASPGPAVVSISNVVKPAKVAKAPLPPKPAPKTAVMAPESIKTANEGVGPPGKPILPWLGACAAVAAAYWLLSSGEEPEVEKEPEPRPAPQMQNWIGNAATQVSV